MKQAAVLWTGGKDCALAMYKAKKHCYDVVRLITFVPKNPDFKAHPIEVIKKQADLLKVSLEFIEIVDPYDLSYEKAIQRLIDQGIECLITGDIDYVNNTPNWIDERCKSLDIEVYKPLWQKGRRQLVQSLIDLKFEVIISAVKSEYFDSSWIGKTLDMSSLVQLEAYSLAKGVDICGENGEYHSIVLDCPMFTAPLELNKLGIYQHNDLKVAKVSVPT